MRKMRPEKEGINRNSAEFRRNLQHKPTVVGVEATVPHLRQMHRAAFVAAPVAASMNTEARAAAAMPVAVAGTGTVLRVC